MFYFHLRRVVQRWKLELKILQLLPERQHNNSSVGVYPFLLGLEGA